MTADIKNDIANEALRIVNGARRSAYGPPESNFERIAAIWNTYIEITDRKFVHGREGCYRATLRFTPTDVAAMMRLMKEARLCETPDHRDSYVDLVGYALCGAEVAGVSVAEPGHE